jgi:hypothetical protein
MRNRSNDKKTLADPGATHLELRFYPYAAETQAILVVARGLGDRATRLRVWSGLLAVSRGDLRGLSPSECTDLLTGHLQRALAETGPIPVALVTDNLGAEGIGVPLGTAGGTVMQLELPFDGPVR